ncbi:pimeloyl-ACP methyl ester carboxylesterase [Bradyrhizobium sp. LB9.1b]
MQTFHVNGYDMAYLEVGEGPPLVCVHGTLGDFRTWYSVLGPLSKAHRVISVSLRHFFPEHWDAVGDDYKMAQHVTDVIAFIEQVEPAPVDLMGHSRGGHIAFPAWRRRGPICCENWCWPSRAAISTPACGCLKARPHIRRWPRAPRARSR